MNSYDLLTRGSAESTVLFDLSLSSAIRGKNKCAKSQKKG
ncbi:Unannotated [Lentimonas sp. CC19]|nr:Unannotated [Lentimonas sp. CC10]CAA6695568.1 Unannotated [Lentimonas sp. CC19]CAA7069899.1 Unannotated [Lentimonas sp. CC11]